MNYYFGKLLFSIPLDILLVKQIKFNSNVHDFRIHSVL